MMSDDFVPLNQSTPLNRQKQWQGQNFQQGGQTGNWQQNPRRGSFNKRGGNFQRNNSFGNHSHSSKAKDQSIDAYLHPSMLQDPWAYLRRKYAESQSF